MAKYKFLAFFALSFFVKFAAGQQYTPMTANGYQMKRVKADSTLHLPSFCGVPTLRSSTAIQGALALDTCNNKLYKWTNQAGWTEVAGGGGSTDTTSLSNRIDQRVKYTDTAAMLLPYLEIIDTTGKFVANVTKKNDSTITIIKGNTQTDLIITGGVGGGGGGSTDTTSLSNRINNAYTTITKLSDTSFFLTKPNTLKDTIKFNKDVVYTQSPIMSMVSNDSNIIYFNADTANVWRSGGTTNYGSGTDNYIAKWNADTLTNSEITDNGTTIGFGNGMNMDSASNLSRLYAGGLYLQGSASSGNRVTIGTIGGNTSPSSTELAVRLSDISATSGTKNALDVTARLLHTSGNQEVNMVRILPEVNQSGTPTNTLRGIYYNPTLTTTVTNNISIQSTSGDVILSGLKNRTTTTDSIAVFHGDTLKKAAYPTGGGGAADDTSTVVIMKVRNATGTVLSKGEVVYLFGSTGNNASVKRANNKWDSTSSKTIGMVRRDIAIGDTGWVTTQGQIEKLNLGAFSEGDVLYLDSIDGGLTKTKPIAPYHTVFIGVVERANAGNGLAYIKPQNGYELEELHDVNITTPTNNQVLVYSDTQSLWKNRNVYTVVDTTPFQRKNVAAYTFKANNTGSAANMTDISFRQSGMQTYTGAITWTGTAPSGATTHTYNFTQVGNMVTLNITLVYATAGSGLTNVTLAIPSDCPAPIQPTGVTGGGASMYYGNFQLSSTLTYSATARNSVIRRNAGNTDNEIFSSFASSGARAIWITIQYFTN